MASPTHASPPQPSHTPPGSPPLNAIGYCKQCSSLMEPPLEKVWIKPFQARHGLFHAPCGKCSLAGPQAYLCSICNHLRLPHLLCCYPGPAKVTVRLGSWQDLRQRCEAGCKQCRLIYLASQSFAESYRINTAVDKTICTINLTIVSRNPESPIPIPFPGKVLLSLIDHTGQRFSHLEGLHVYFTDKNLDAPETPLLYDSSHFVTPLVQWNRVRKLLNQCSISHDQCHAIATQHQHRSPPADFRLIDVKARRLIKPTSKCKFVALSYVWGKNLDQSKLTALTSNIHQLEKNGGLALGKVATTIEEAMVACEHLKERYLWADRLCIVQDDLSSKQVQINAMGDIFALAELVIIVASGSNVDEHVPGIVVPRLCTTEIPSLGGYRAMNVFPRLWHLQEHSVWGSRGWTYQEAAIPNRKLYLTAVQYVFECMNGHVYEDNALNENPWESIDIPFGMDYFDQIPLTFNTKDPFDYYQSHVSKFNTRGLTNIEDFYNAFQGITSGLYQSADSCWYGLPKKHFDQAMLWRPLVTPSGFPHPRRRSSTKILLPTWSWASVECKITEDPHSHGKFCGPLTDWLLIEADGKLSRLETTEPSETYHDRHNLEKDPFYRRNPPNWQLMLGLAVAEGCIYSGPLIEPHFWLKTRFVDSAHVLGQRWSTYHDFISESFSPDRWKQLDVPQGSTALAANVQVATLEVARHPHHYSLGRSCPKSDTCLEIRLEGICIGMIELDIPGSFSDQEINNTGFVGISISSCPSRPDIQCLNANPSVLAPDDPGNNPEEREKLTDTILAEFRRLQRTYTDSNDKLLLPIPVVNVLMIAREAAFVTRQGIGWIFLRIWGQVERKHQTVFFK